VVWRSLFTLMTAFGHWTKRIPRTMSTSIPNVLALSEYTNGRTNTSLVLVTHIHRQREPPLEVVDVFVQPVSTDRQRYTYTHIYTQARTDTGTQTNTQTKNTHVHRHTGNAWIRDHEEEEGVSSTRPAVRSEEASTERGLLKKNRIHIPVQAIWTHLTRVGDLLLTVTTIPRHILQRVINTLLRRWTAFGCVRERVVGEMLIVVLSDGRIGDRNVLFPLF
jgi:hypothetical protein